MSRYVTANFLDNNGAPALGLSPTIRIRRVDTGELLVSDAAMVEVGDGGYKYEFAGYTSGVVYQVRCDAGSGLMSRYAWGASPEDDSATLAAMTATLTELSDMTVGTWELQAPNVLIFYKPDGVTELMRFNCFDLNGNPTLDAITKVERVV